MNLLITGGAGFIGSNFIIYLLDKYEDITIVNLDKLTYAGDLENLNEVQGIKNYQYIHGDICDKKLVQELFKEYRFDGVIHFAAESHVDNSILNPETFVRTNVLGTLTLLEETRKLWMEAPYQHRKDFKNSRFHHISTDEVFGTLDSVGFFTEESPISPNSPYSASKASSDMLVRSYFQTYGMNVVTSNCSNNFGPKQHTEKLIPTIIRKALDLETIPIYGDGENIRDWLYVLDHCSAIEKVFFEGKQGETYLIGANNPKRNIEIAELICEILDSERPLINKTIKSYKQLIRFVTDRPGHDYRYAIDASKIKNKLGWIPKYTFKRGIEETIKYYLERF